MVFMRRMKFVFSALVLAFALTGALASCSHGSAAANPGADQTGSDPFEYNALPGVFTVGGNGERVSFAKGNLYHSGDSASEGWGFERNQYDYRTWHYGGESNAVIGGLGAQTPPGSTGLFSWSNDAGVSFSESYSDPDRTSADVFFVRLESRFSGSDWDVLNDDEWRYLLGLPSRASGSHSSRANASAKWGMACISVPSGARVCGLVILPDDWTSPSGCSFSSGSGRGFSTNCYDVAKWQRMEDAGAVFLPASGCRSDSDIVGSDGYYWTSGHDDGEKDAAYGLYFKYNGIGITSNSRSYGKCVRLVVRNIV